MSEFEAKANLRREIRDRLRAMDAAIRAEASLRICREAANHAAFRDAHCVALFAPLPTEPDIEPLIEEAWAEKKRVAFPFMLKPRELQWHEVGRWEDLAIRGAMNLREPDPVRCPRVAPSEIDCAFIPGVAFDHEGHRLGRGGGYYDAFLASAPHRAVCIGLMFGAQKVDRIPREPHDYPLKIILTER